MKKTLALLAMLMLCNTLPAFAADTAAATATAAAKGDKTTRMLKKGGYYLNRMDTNKDGRVSPSEHEAFAEQMFRDADTNGDKMLTSQEIGEAKMKEAQMYRAEMGARGRKHAAETHATTAK